MLTLTVTLKLLVCLEIMFLSASALPPWAHKWNYGHWPGRPSGHDHDYHRYPGRHRVSTFYPRRCKYGVPCEELVQQDYEDYVERPSNLGCSCLVYVASTEVFRRIDTSQRYPCSGYGLRKCTRYCEELFGDEGFRERSRQDACDVVGRQIFSPWYQKIQVCGDDGPYRDFPIEPDLCCRRGRPSLECSEERRAS